MLIVKTDGVFTVDGEELVQLKDGNYRLPKNAIEKYGRKFVNATKLNKNIPGDSGEFEDSQAGVLGRVLGAQGKKDFAKLAEPFYEFLSPEDVETFKAIISEAQVAYDAAIPVKKPKEEMTEIEKIQARIARAEKRLAALQAETAEESVEDGGNE